jgi:hypothetical protein
MEGYEKKRRVGQYLQYAGIGLGVIVAILIVKWHPVLIGLEVIGAMLYFGGEYLRKV